MTEKKFSYYQYHSAQEYPVFLRFEDAEFEGSLVETLTNLGFDKVENDVVKKESFEPYRTRVLKVVKANAKVSRQIDKIDYAVDKYGAESLSPQSDYTVYRYKGVGMMIFGERNLLWELGLKNVFDNEAAIRVILTRFLSFALEASGVLGFWGVPVDEGFVVMKPAMADFEAVFVDVKKNLLLTCEGVKDLAYDLQILRLDDTLNNEVKTMSSEELMGFLSMNTSLMAYDGFNPSLRDSLMKLSQLADGFVYPKENFQPRNEAIA